MVCLLIGVNFLKFYYYIYKNMSSDSDDDCYGNVSEKLQKMKDQYKEDRVETSNLLDDSANLDDIIKRCGVPEKTKRKSKSVKTGELPVSSVSDLPDVSIDNSEKKTSKRMTRAAAKKSNIEVNTQEVLPQPRPKRQKINTDTTESGPARGRTGRRGRGTPRGRNKARGRSRWWALERNHQMLESFINAVLPNRSTNTWDPSIPTYSVGNTDEYPDHCDNQTLFSKKDQDDVAVVEEDQMEDNEELSVKVYWQSSELFKFTIRRFQKISQIFDYFAKKENVTHDKLLFTFNDKILRPDDTPESIHYSIAKFIDGGIVTQSVLDLVMKDDEKIKDGVHIKFQCQNMKKPFEVTVQLDDKLSLAMVKCSEYLEKPLQHLRFEFDGDSLTGKSTARELEFEGGECIDVRIIT